MSTIIPKIAVISGVQGDTRRYRAFHLREQLLLSGVDCRYGHITSPQTERLFRTSNILILQRVTWNRHVERLLREAKQRGTLILADVDDLIFLPESYRWIDSPDFADPIRLGLYQENLKRNRETLLRCDGIIASTDFLAHQAQQILKPTWVHRNGFSLEMWAHALSVYSASQFNREIKVILGYASGTPTHDNDFALIRPVLQRLLNEYPHLHLYLVGHIRPGESWNGVEDKIHHLPFVPWRDLPKILARFSVNLAPLRVDNPFSQSKSEIKFMEAALVRVPTVASPTSAFQYAIRHGENGFLAATPEEWEENLRLLIENATLRRTVGECAYQDVVNRYAPWKRATEICALLNDAFEQLGVELRLSHNNVYTPIEDPRALRHLWLTAEVERHPTLVERGLYTLRTRGARVLLKEIWIFFRRLVAPIFPFRDSVRPK